MSIAKNDHFDRGQILRLEGREKVMSKLHNCLSNRIMQFTLEAATEDLLRNRSQHRVHFTSHHKSLQMTEERDPQADILQYSEEQSCQTGVAGSPPPQHTWSEKEPPCLPTSIFRLRPSLWSCKCPQMNDYIH